jgi:Mitochondrial carrier protein
MYEFFKHHLSYLLHHKPCSLRPYEASLCGSVAGGVAAAVTTPLDVLKTRVMLDLRVRVAEFASQIMPLTHGKGPKSSCLPVTSPSTWTNIYIGGCPRLVCRSCTKNNMDICWWGSIFGYV